MTRQVRRTAALVLALLALQQFGDDQRTRMPWTRFYYDPAVLHAQSGTVMPVPVQQFFDASGNPLAGGLLYTYAAGTTTPLATYTDNALSVANANPVVMDSAGRPSNGSANVGIYLSPTSYKFVLKTSGGATLWTLDNVTATSVAAAQATDVGICNVRVTLTSGTPVPSSDVTAAATVYVTPYKGSRCALYSTSTSSWNIRSFTELNIALGSDTTGKNYDVFAYDNNGAMAVERLVWTNDTTRATGLTYQDGVLVKSGDASRRYVGTYRTSGTGQTEDSLAKRFVWNYYNRVPRIMQAALETADNWNYTLATWRKANNSDTNRLEAVIGWAEVAVEAHVIAVVGTSAGTANARVAIGEDVTNTPVAKCLIGNTNATSKTTITARMRRTPAVGWHFWQWIEISDAAGLTTWYGDDAATNQSGISGVIDG